MSLFCSNVNKTDHGNQISGDVILLWDFAAGGNWSVSTCSENTDFDTYLSLYSIDVEIVDGNVRFRFDFDTFIMYCRMLLTLSVLTRLSLLGAQTILWGGLMPFVHDQIRIYAFLHARNLYAHLLVFRLT